MPMIHAITGKAIGSGGLGLASKVMDSRLGLEMMYSFIIIACSIMIYFGTRELYELSKHKGIKYFRKSFLFFAIAYGFRSLIKYVTLNLDIPRILEVYPRAFYFGLGKFTLLVFMYFSAMAIFYLLYSVIWEKCEKQKFKTIPFHILAIIIAIITTHFANTIIYLGINLFLLMFLILTFKLSKKQHTKKKKSSLHVIYTLMFFFWTINILDILIPDFLRTFQLIMYMFSAGIFLSMLYKVLRKTGSS